MLNLLLTYHPDLHSNASPFLSNLALTVPYGKDAVQKMLDAGAKPVADALGFAVLFGSTDLIEMLLKQGVDINGHSYFAGTALAAAITSYGDIGWHGLSNQVQLVKLLLKYHPDVNADLGGSESPLHRAVSYGYEEIVGLLLDAGAKPDARSLQNAIFNGNTNLVRTLLSHGADVNGHGYSGGTALHAAVSSPDTFSQVMFEMILAAKPNFNATNDLGQTPVHQITCAPKSAVAILLKLGADVNARDRYGRTPLHLIANKDNHYDDSCGTEDDVESARFLFEHGADINLRDSFDRSALQIATFSRHTNTAAFLIASGANDLAYVDQVVDFHQAAGRHDSNTVARMLASNRKLARSADDEGRTPMHKLGTLGIARILVSNEANVNATSLSGKTPLHVFTAQGWDEHVKWLLANGANVNAKTVDGQTPLHFAQQKEIVRLLLDHHADVSIAGTRLLSAVERDDFAVVQSLLEAGANPNVRDRSQSLLHLAIQHSRVDIRELLLAHGANINMQSNMGWGTPLIEAVVAGNTLAVMTLLAHGADPNLVNGDGRSALLLARERDQRQIIHLLRKYGGHE